MSVASYVGETNVKSFCVPCVGRQFLLPIQMVSHKTMKGNTGGHVSAATTVKLNGDASRLINHVICR